jgi:hypothetical protein
LEHVLKLGVGESPQEPARPAHVVDRDVLEETSVTPRRELDACAAAIDALEGFVPLEVLDRVLRPLGVEARPAVGCSQVSHDEQPTDRVAGALDLVQAVVVVLEVPVGEDRHHHDKALELPRADEGIAVPLPLAGATELVELRPEPAGRRRELDAASVQPPVAQVVDGRLMVAHGPQEAGGGDLRAGFDPHLDLPHHTLAVEHFVLRAEARLLLAQE